MYFIGLMSGTSMDAIDTVLIRFTDVDFDVIEYEQYPIAHELRQAVRKLSSESSIDEVSILDVNLGYLFADASLKIIKQANLATSDISAIGSHGQTVLHMPAKPHGHTLQIGNASIIAYKTGITTVADFRSMDIAAGGEGAPLASAFHNCYFRSKKTDRVILNIGGVANITVLPRDKNIKVMGFDTGPGNGLLDDWNYRHKGTNMDTNSAWAKTGKTDPKLLQILLSDPYFKQLPPKSSGRDYFNLDWLNNYLEDIDKTIKPEDIQATLLELTVTNITEAVKKYAAASKELYVCGGGAHNSELINTIDTKLSGINVSSTEKLGINPDAVEAMTFAWLAKCRLEHTPGNLPSVTGAERAVILGAIYEYK